MLAVWTQNMSLTRRAPQYTTALRISIIESKGHKHTSPLPSWALQNGVYCFLDWCLSLLRSALSIDLPCSEKQNKAIFFSIIFSLLLHCAISPFYSFSNLCCRLIQFLLQLIIRVVVLLIALFQNSISKSS